MRFRHHALRALTLAALALTASTVAACSDTNHGDGETATTETTAPSTGAPPALPGDELLGDPDGIEEEEVDDGPQTPTAEMQEDARGVAVEGLETYYAAEKSRDDWFADLSPYLSTMGKQAYGTVDPAQIEPVNIDSNGEVRTVSMAGRGEIILAVPTDAGDVQVELLIEEPNGPWLIDRFTFPKSTP